MSASATAIPINVITGFLGSGKTTLLGRLLASPEMGETAVLLNEFGEVGLDHHLLERVDERTVMLPSGCVCCTIREDLGTTARVLLERRARGEIPPFRRLVIETSGLADPVPILYTLATEPMVKEGFRLANVIATVDALNGPLHLARHPETAKQAAVADRIVLTKTDLAEASAVAELEARIGRLNPSAQIFRAPSEALTPKMLLTGETYEPDAKAAEVARWLNAEAFRDAPRHGAKPGTRHDARIAAYCLTFEKPIDWVAFAVWLTMLLHSRGEDVLRVKGLLHIAGVAGPVVVHGVQHVIHPPRHLEAWPDGDERSRIVLIVRDIAREAIEASLATFNALSAEVEASTEDGLRTRMPTGAGTQVGGRPFRRPAAPAWMK